MKLLQLLSVTALTVLASTTDARAFTEGLVVYTTSNPAVAANEPTGAAGNPWDAPGAGGSTTIAGGTTVWFGFINTEKKGLRKYFRYALHAPAGGLIGPQLGGAVGYESGDDSDPASSTFVSSYSDGHLLVREYRISPQPEWETFSYSNPAGHAAVVVTVEAVSACADSRPDDFGSTLTVTTASIGSASPGAMYATPRFNAIWVFPATNAVNAAAAHPFSAPPASGVWSRSIVNQTPTGDPRPLGGVLWRTLGPGLAPDENFAFALTQMSSPADRVYELFVGATQGQQSFELTLDWTNLEPIAYCSGKTNSLGCTPAIASQGVPSAIQQNGFLVTCSQMRNNKPGVLIYSVQGRAANPFQGGTLCVMSPIRRTLGLASGGSSAPANDCSGTFTIDMNMFAHGLLGGTPAPELLQPGRAIDCQWWSRDTQDPFGSSLSDALEYVIR